jgi:hypothetical protein
VYPRESTNRLIKIAFLGIDKLSSNDLGSTRSCISTDISFRARIGGTGIERRIEGKGTAKDLVIEIVDNEVEPSSGVE